MHSSMQCVLALAMVISISGRQLRLSWRQKPAVVDDDIEGINEAIFRARERRDNIEFDCKWSKEKYKNLVSEAHSRQFSTDSTIAQLRAKETTAQAAYTQTIMQIEKVKLKRSEQIKFCARFKELGSQQMEGNKFTGDLAKSLGDLVKCGQPGFLQGVQLNCHDGSDGNQTIDFENSDLQAKTQELGEESYKRLQVSLLALFHARSSDHQAPPTPPVPEPKVDVRKCLMPNRLVDCAALSDSMSQLKGLLGDMGDRNAGQMRKIADNCVKKKQSIDRNLVNLNNMAKTTSETLVNLGKEISAASRQQHIASRGHQDASDEMEAHKKRCKYDTDDLEREICELKKRRTDLLRIRGQSGLLVDCEVGPWEPKAPCSKTCGGGKQTFTRTLVNKAAGGAKCPSMSIDTDCNTGKCPVDCKIGEWTPWTACSVTCGTGVQSRKREVQVEAKNGGTACEPTLDSRVCSGPPCEGDCVLAEFGPWGQCTKACGGGKKIRTRGIKQKATGRSRCPKVNSKERREFAACNAQACPKKDGLKCSSKTDLIMLLDGSGSITQETFEKQKAFAIDLAGRFTLDKTKGYMIGAVIYGEGAQTVFPLTDDAAVMQTKIGSLRRGDGGASLSGGLNEAKKLLGKGRKDASNLVFVLADGPADSKDLSAEASRSLQKYGVRVVVSLVGEGVDPSPLKALASAPKKENFFNPKSFEELQRDVQSRMFEICPAIA